MDSDSFTFDSPVRHRDFELLRTSMSPGVSREISADTVRRHYEVMSLPYRLFWGEHLHHGLFLTGCESPRQAQVRLIEFCSDLVKIRPGAKVLDVGCGYGTTAIYLANNFRCTVDGLTLSPKQARIARTKIARAGVGDRVRVGIGDAEQLHFNGQYDVIWMMESSEHFEDKAGFIHKTAQLLREHGKFVIAAWTAADAHPLVKELARLTVCPGFQTAEDYARQLCRAGLDIITISDLSQKVLPSWEISYRRATRVRLLWRLMPA